MTKTTADRIDFAERLSQRRARLFPGLGIVLIVADAVTSFDNVEWPTAAIWLALCAAGFVLTVTGGVPSRLLRRLTEDETTRAHRAQAVLIGYCAALACGAGLYVVSMFQVISATQAVQIVLTTAVAAPLIGFGVLESLALGHD